MNTSAHPYALGVFFAVFATLCWGLNFIVPYVTGNYSTFDFLAVKFMIVGVIGVVWMIVDRTNVRELTLSMRAVALTLGAIGYLGYSVCIACGVKISGPVLTPAFIAVVPVMLALLGNAQNKVLAWRKLALPLSMLVFGLLLINIMANDTPLASQGAAVFGVFFSVCAVAFWLAFSVLNQKGLSKIPAHSTSAWTGLMMVGSSLGMLLVMPLGYAFNLFEIPSQGASFANAGGLYVWAFLIAILSSVLGAWAWNKASRYLPMVLSGQLIALESLFATLFGLLFEQRLPTVYETLGITAVLAGAMLAIRRLLAYHEMVQDKPTAS
ncbi:DMT family transporter [Pseudomonas proteolytica]|uniref:DMT family transporter n=1 Tax=Pseudomonas proteolytica TaxID=219574 RepID=UPI0032079F9B